MLKISGLSKTYNGNKKAVDSIVSIPIKPEPIITIFLLKMSL